jgi:hypothetical protein
VREDHCLASGTRTDEFRAIAWSVLMNVTGATQRVSPALGSPSRATIRKERHDEASSHFRWHQEREHPECAGRHAGQTDRRVQRPLRYAIDDQTAIKVTDGNVEVVSEGHWKLFSP